LREVGFCLAFWPTANLRYTCNAFRTGSTIPLEREVSSQSLSQEIAR
jgi:hypothetical protein